MKRKSVKSSLNIAHFSHPITLVTLLLACLHVHVEKKACCVSQAINYKPVEMMMMQLSRVSKKPSISATI